MYCNNMQWCTYTEVLISP